MATQTDDVTSNNGESAQTSYIDKMAEVKRNLDAKAGGDSSDFVDEDKDGTTNNDDAEADNATNDDTAGDDTTDDDTTDDSTDDSEDDTTDDDKTQGSDFRFSQFKGDGTEESYRKNLENAYLNSSNEAINLKNERDGFERQVEAIKAAAGKDPEFGEKLLGYLNGGNGSQGGSGGDKSDDSKPTQDSNNPFLKNAETEWNKKSEESVKVFVDANPEVMTDPKINADVKRWMRVFSNDIYENEGRLITAGEAMEMAYRHLGLEDKRSKTQDLVDGMKKNAAPTRPQAAKKKPSKSGGNTKQFSDLTMDIASRMGISKERLAKGSKR